MLVDGKKTCPRCSETKLAEGNFYRTNRPVGDGFHGYCIPCVKAAAVEWQKANPEKKRASDARQQARRPKKGRFKYLTDAERRAAAASAQAKYNAKPEHKLVHRNREHLRRMTLRSGDFEVSGALTLAEWQQILASFSGRCAYCGSTERIEMDHVVPLSKGGQHVASNIVPACKPCNSGKRDRALSEWLN